MTKSVRVPAVPFKACFIHGVGQQKSDFADIAVYRLGKALGKRGHSLSHVSVHWSPRADRYQRRFLRAVKSKGSKGNMSQELVIGTLSDALMYTTDQSLREAIQHDVDVQLTKLGEGVTFFAHSLGGLIIADYLRSRPHIQDVRLVTLGCNIGLFHIGRTFEAVPQLSQGKWLNLYSKRDMLGYPINLGEPGLAAVTDVPVAIGGLFRGWTGLVHTQYWDDRGLWSSMIPKLLDRAAILSA